MTIKENEKFYGKIWKTGNSQVVTIPDNIIEGVGLKVGDELVILVRKNEVKVDGQRS